MIKYAIGGVAIVGLVFAVYSAGMKQGRSALITQMAEAKVKVLKDGEEIDLAVDTLDDDGLCAAIGGC